LERSLKSFIAPDAPLAGRKEPGRHEAGQRGAAASMEGTPQDQHAELREEMRRLCRLRRSRPVVYALTAGRTHFLRRAAGWALVVMLAFIAALFGVLAGLFAAGSTPRYMFAIVSAAFALGAAALAVLHFRSRDPGIAAVIQMTRQDAAASLRRRGAG
jgi:hypothetical protein